MNKSMPQAMMLLSALFYAMLLSACAGQTPPPQVIKIKPPANLLSCAPAPAFPGAAMTQKDVARYCVDLHFAWEDCAAKLKRVKELTQ